jgi:hypothetical protein
MTSLSDHAKPPVRAERQPGPRDEKKENDSSKLGEAEFLRQEADRARKAVANTWAEAKANLMRGVDPRAWTGEHPWIALSAGAVAGFFAAYAVVPSKEEQALKRLARIEQALSGGAPVTAPAANATADGNTQKSGFLGSIGGEILKTLRPALASALSAVISAKTMQPNDGASDPGQDPSMGGGASGAGAAAGLDPSLGGS